MKELEVSPYTLAFTEVGEEDKYRVNKLESDLPLLRYLSLLAFFVELMYSIKDILWSPHVPDIVVSFRLYYLTPLLFVTYLLSYTDWIKKHPNNLYILSITVMSSLILGQYYMTAMNENIDSSYAKTLPLIFFSTYLFSGIKFKHVFYITPILIVSYVVVIVFFENIDATTKINDSLLVLMNVILAIFFKYTLEHNRRKGYVRRLVIEENEKKLEETLQNEKTLSSLRKDLIAILAHDIRAPLGNLKGIIKMLDSKTINSDQGQELLGKVGDRIEVITKGVNDLLVWVKSKEEGLELDVSEIQIDDLISEILVIGKEQLEAKKILITTNIEEGLAISSDEGALQTIIRNLLSNAIKFSFENKEVLINAFEKSGQVIFEIIDFGIGMDEKTKKKVEETFYSTKGTNNEYGVGLGLQICFTLLEKLNSELIIDSIPNAGTKMSFGLKNIDLYKP